MEFDDDATRKGFDSQFGRKNDGKSAVKTMISLSYRNLYLSREISQFLTLRVPVPNLALSHLESPLLFLTTNF